MLAVTILGLVDLLPISAPGAPAAEAAATVPAVTETVEPTTYRTPLENLVAAERDFAAAAAKVGIKTAFLDVLAPDSILYRGGIVNGREWQEKQPDDPGAKLSWYPSVAFLAESGDYGYTSGPWEFHGADPAPTARVAFGHFVSLWRRERQGARRWRLVCDIGVSHPKIEPRVAAWLRPFDDRSAANEARPAQPLLPPTPMAAELGELVTVFDAPPEGVEALRALRRQWCAADVRVYRPGRVPLVGREAVLADEAIAGESLRAGLERMFLSDAGDLGATISAGVLARPSNGGVESREACVMRFWHRGLGEKWALVLEVVNLAPLKPAA